MNESHKPYKQGPGEELVAIESMDGEQQKKSSERRVALENQGREMGLIVDRMRDTINMALVDFDIQLSVAEESAKEKGTNSHDIIKDAREAKRIASDIRSSIQELNALRFITW